VAYVEPHPGSRPTLSDLREHLHQRLPAFMVPSAFVLLEQLPTTASGKVDRGALPGLEQKGVAQPQAPTRPSSDLQCQLIAIWEKVLDVRPIGITDDFFELGGHSLRALRLVDDMQQSLGIAIDLPVLFAAPTVEAMARYVTEAHDRPSKPMAVPLQSHGSAPPLFCLHGLSYYRELAQLLGPEQPVYGIYVPTKGYPRKGEGSPQSVRPQAYVAWLAGQCLEQIRAIEPTGPYRLAGVSFGGLLAFEIAQQLHADGQQVELVALLDSVLPRALRRSPARYLVYYLRRAGELGARRCWQRFGQSMARSWQRIHSARNGNTATNAACLDGPADDATIPNREHGTLLDAMREYQLVPYPGRIVLFRSVETRKKNHPFLAPDYGWRDAASGGLTVHDLPGSHLGLLKQPHVRVLARHLRDYLGHTVLPDASPSNDRSEP
jgi:thioesterase domain-containing protein/acyl carrier protein